MNVFHMSTARLAGRPAGLYELTAGAGDRRCRRLASVQHDHHSLQRSTLIVSKTFGLLDIREASLFHFFMCRHVVYTNRQRRRIKSSV